MLVDLVVLDTHPPTYNQEANDRIVAAVLDSGEAGVRDQPGGIFVRRADVIAPDVLLMLRATARVHVACEGQSLSRTLEPVMDGEYEPESGGGPATLRLSERSTPQVVRAIQRITSMILDQVPSLGGDGNGSKPGEASGSATSVVDDDPPDAVPDTSSLVLGNGIGGLTPEGEYRSASLATTCPPPRGRTSSRT